MVENTRMNYFALKMRFLAQKLKKVGGPGPGLVLVFLVFCFFGWAGETKN